MARPEWSIQRVDALATTLTPIAIAAVGFALRFVRIVDRLAAVGVGLGHRPAIASLAIRLMDLVAGLAFDPIDRVAMLEMAMPTSVGWWSVITPVAALVGHGTLPGLD